MKTFLQPLQGLAEIEEIEKQAKKNHGILEVSGCIESQKAHLMYGLSGLFPSHLVIAADEKTAKDLYEDYRFYDKRVYYYPAKDLLFFQADIHGNLLIRQRMQVIRALLERQEEITVVTSIDGCMDYLLPLEKIEKQLIHFRNDSSLDMDKLTAALVHMGYERVGQVEMPGQFSIRGGIIDIYSLTEENPWRIELWGDEIDSIRSFDAESQRSLENVDEITIYPAAEKMDGEDMVSFLDYFPEEKTLVFLDEPIRLLERMDEAEEEYRESLKNREAMEMEAETAALSQVFSVEEVTAKINQRYGIAFTMLESKCGNFHLRKTYSIQTKSVNPYNNSFEMLTRDLKRLKRSGYRVVLLSGLRTRAKRLAEDLRDYDLSSFYSEDADREVQDGEILVSYGHVTEGYEYPMLKFMVISETDIFGRKKRKKKRHKTYSGQKIQDFSELKVGDYVVHENHGLGIYEGIEKIQVDKVTKDYMKISYAGGGALYILATQLDLIQKYASADARKPKLNRLGTQDWTRTRKRVKSAVQLIAKDLVKLYAARQEQEGFVYGEDTVWQREFEEMFPFEETEDQMLAIDAVKQDMESTKIMDRLICGDVGFGKTEVAARAAFKAVVDNKQVAFLCPTTILSLQHYKTFIKRFENFPVTIAVINRFITPADQRKILEGLKEGTIDILIGTHRLSSKDVVYKDLGLLVIDEEQRFGVEHKEKIKELKNSVDVLSLSATPIPRTLQMSLIGIRSLSQLETPPLNRMPVQTYVIEKNFSMIKEIIQRELARNGQVFYLYNNVKEIYNVAAKLREALPDIEVGVAHGKMERDDIEDVMMQFTDNKYQVLVCTTIIETGIDIPNANTILIEDADHFGLSQLYQIKGRVGRSDRLAYAYLMYSPDKQLSEIAMKRLKSIKEFTQLGSGYKIAMRDLTIRGAGDMLGPQQAGFIDTVGIDMYIEMLNSAIMEKKGIKKEVKPVMKKANVKVDAYIPHEFANEDYEKITLYQRMDAITTKKELLDMQEEIKDNYGKLPKAVQLLFEKKRLDILLNEPHVENITEEQKFVNVTFTSAWSTRIDGVKLFEMMTSISKDTRIRYVNSKISMKLPKTKDWLYKMVEILERTDELVIKNA